MFKGIPAGTNLFAYCNNNPVNNSDPTGKAVGALTTATVAIYIVKLLCVIGIVLLASYIISSIDFKPVISAIKDLCSSQALKIKTAYNLIKGIVKSSYNYAKKTIKKSTKAAASSIIVATSIIKIKQKVKKNSKQRYWKAYLNRTQQGQPYITLGSPVSYSNAKSMIKNTTTVNILCVKKSEARTLTGACGGIFKYHSNSFKEGYFPHYHPKVKKAKHIWFVF